MDEPASGANPVVSAVDPVLDAKLPEFMWHCLKWSNPNSQGLSSGFNK